METVHELFIEQIRDVYSAEQQITKALPKMVQVATAPALKKAFQNHLKETETQIQRLETIAQELGERPSGKKCKGMEGLLEEGKEVIEEEGNEAVIDLALIVAAQRVEHYEISAYGNLAVLADQLGFTKIGKLLKQTLNEEEKTDQLLTAITQKNILPKAPMMEEEDDDEDEDRAANE